MLSRRGLLGCLTGIIAAPMIVKIDSIMPVKVMRPTAFDVGLFYCPYMPFTIEKIIVRTKSRALNAQYTRELADYDLIDNKGYDYIAEGLRKDIDYAIIQNILENKNGISEVKRPNLKDKMRPLQLLSTTIGPNKILPRFG
jgi:hypothetical protein